MPTRRAALGAAAALLAAPALRAQPAWPMRPLRIIVTYPPGGVTDITARLVAEPLAQRLGQPVLVENRPGAGGNIGVQAAMAAEPDGYTLLLGTAATHGVNPVLYAASGVDPVRDFACIGTIADMPNVLSVNPQVLDVASVASLVAEARRRPLSYASVGNGSSSHFCAAMFLRAAGIEATHVPYRGSAPAIAALRGGEVAFLFDTTATSTMQIRAGAFRALAVTAAHRSAALPDVPTLIEAGLPGYDIAVWNALCLHRRAPAAVLARLREAFAAAMAPPMDDRLRGAFVEPLRIPAAELDAWQAADQAKWMRMTRELNMAVD